MSEPSPQLPAAAAVDVAANLGAVRAALEKACARAGRESASVKLIAVSKTFAPEHILPALEAGARVFGENRVQEALAKWPALKQRFPDIELHLIGPLQTNKVKDAVALFDVIHTLDRLKLARALAREMAAQGRSLACYIEVNTGEEAQKHGVAPHEVDDFVRECRDTLRLKIEGLMCIPPQNEEASLHFALLRKLAERNGLAGLSMGMSGDYETAIEFGATAVRVGSAIFGARG